MDAETAARLAAAGASLLCLGVPAGTHFGLDYSDWVVGPRFQGVKMVPPGTHFVWVSAAGSMGDLAPRTGFFFTSAAGDVAVARWDAEVELLQMVSPAQDDDVERLCEAVRRREFDSGLAPYPLKTWDTWYSLVSDVTREHVARLAGSDVALQLPSTAAVLKRGGDEASCGLHFTAVAGVGPGARGEDITQYAMDTTPALLPLLRGADGVSVVVSELQVAFIAFLQGQMLQAFRHWKTLVDMLCRCEDLYACSAPTLQGKSLFCVRPQLIAALRAFRAQLVVVPQDFCSDVLSHESFLSAGLVFLSKCRVVDAAVADAVTAVLLAARERFGAGVGASAVVRRAGTASHGAGGPAHDGADGGVDVNDDDDDDDDPPVVVELPPGYDAGT